MPRACLLVACLSAATGSPAQTTEPVETVNRALRFSGLGRMSVNTYLLSEYRGVGAAYPLLRPPTEFYSLVPSGFDGVDVSQSWRAGTDSIWKLAGYYGVSKQGNNITNSYRPLHPIGGVFLSREEQGLLLTASASRARIGGEVLPILPLIEALQPLTELPVPTVAAEAATLQQRLMSRRLTVEYFGLGVNFDRDDWLSMMEVSRIELDDVRIDVGYALLGRRFGRATAYVSTGAARGRGTFSGPQWTASLTPVLGPANAAQAQALGEIAYAAITTAPRQRTSSVGMRWDVSAQAALKVQYDHSRIDAQGSLLWANGTQQAARAHVVSAAFDFLF